MTSKREMEEIVYKNIYGTMPRHLGGPDDDHYAALADAVQPIEVIEAWNLPHHLACVIKYLSRYRSKGGLQDLEKARWYLDRFILNQKIQVGHPDV